MIAVVALDIENSKLITDILNELGIENIIPQNEYDFNNADKIILPNVIELKSSVRKLHISNLFTYLRVVQKPVLGIGMGLNLLCEKFEGTACLGFFPEILEADDDKIKTCCKPKEIEVIKENKLFEGIGEDEKFYFDKIYKHKNNQYSTAVLKDDKDICVAVQKNYFYGIQFLPEKSGEAGKRLLKNFCELS